MAGQYDSYLTLFGKSSGSYTGDIYTPGSNRVVEWEGAVDAQDSGKALEHERPGLPVNPDEASLMVTIFFDADCIPSEARLGQDGEVCFPDGRRYTVEVVKMVHLDQQMICKYGRESH